jgi:hypothetical protein
MSMSMTEIASGFDDAVEAEGSVDRASLVEYLVVETVVGTERQRIEVGMLGSWAWDGCCVWCGG